MKTAPRHAEDQLLADCILKEAPAAVLVASPKGIIEKWLGKSEQIFGYTPDEAVGKPVNFMHRPDIRDQITKDVANSFCKNGYFSGIVPCIHKSGKEILVEMNARTVYNNNVPIYLIGIATDITEKKKTEVAYHRQHQ